MAGTRSAQRSSGPRSGPLILKIALLVLVGGPMVYVLWEALNHLLSGDPGAVRWGLVVPVLLVFAIYVYLLSRVVVRWDEEAR